MLQLLTVEPSARAVLLYDAIAGLKVQKVSFMTDLDLRTTSTLRAHPVATSCPYRLQFFALPR